MKNMPPETTNYISLRQKATGVYVANADDALMASIFWNEISAPKDMSTGPLFEDRKRDWGTFMNEIMVNR